MYYIVRKQVRLGQKTKGNKLGKRYSIQNIEVLRNLFLFLKIYGTIYK